MAKRLSAAALLVLGVALLFGKAEAKTKSNPVVEVNIPYAFHIANRTLPAGSYRFELATGTPGPADKISVIIVRNREARVYQAVAVAVSVQPGVGLPGDSRVDFSSGDDHALVSVWKNGDRFDLKPALTAAAEDAGDWTGAGRVVTISSRLSDR